MIDDDFDKIMRRMLENFFGSSFDGNNSGRIHMRLGPNAGMPVQDEMTNQANVEEIELDDSYLVVIDGIPDDELVEVSVQGTELLVSLVESEENDLKITLPYPIDIRESSMSQINGIIEISLKKSINEENSSANGLAIIKRE